MFNSLPYYRAMATELHKAEDHQYGKYPYEYHLAMVEMVARQYTFLLPEKYNTNHMYIACWFHDVLEDCPSVSEETLFQLQLPKESIDLIVAVTDGPGSNRAEQKEHMFKKCAFNMPNTFLKLCDRIVNVRTCLAEQNKFYDMYLNEHPEFYRRLYTGEMLLMWHELDIMLHQWG